MVKYPAKKYVTHCEFLPKMNIFVITVYDKPARTSTFEVYSFRQTGIVSDTFLLRSPSEKIDEFSGRMSMLGLSGT
jgi:hypothetical protein